ncbi:MAG TPA: toll/interleukin-1 receptor domain-containing protein [Tahibacter sp.]|jgi:hypothetical protein|nr:toll/interleukin-1 receptor domain-containing protein [Tahibacter sp.]
MNSWKEPVPVFISYAHADKAYLERLREALQPLIAAADIRVWDDHSLLPGDEYFEAILDRIGKARLFVTLISPAFLASRACRTEVEFALARQKNSVPAIVPVIVEDCGWAATPLAQYQALLRPPANGNGPDGLPWPAIRAGIAAAAEKQREPQRDPEFSIFSNADLMEMLDVITDAVAVIRKANVAHMDNPTLLHIAQLEKRRASYRTELLVRIGRF